MLINKISVVLFVAIINISCTRALHIGNPLYDGDNSVTEQLDTGSTSVQTIMRDSSAEEVQNNDGSSFSTTEAGDGSSTFPTSSQSPPVLYNGPILLSVPDQAANNPELTEADKSIYERRIEKTQHFLNVIRPDLNQLTTSCTSLQKLIIENGLIPMQHESSYTDGQKEEQTLSLADKVEQVSSLITQQQNLIDYYSNLKGLTLLERANILTDDVNRNLVKKMVTITETMERLWREARTTYGTSIV